MADEGNKFGGKLSLNRPRDIKKRNPVIKSRQTHIKHNPHTHAIPASGQPYKPKTQNPLLQQVEKFQQSEMGRELGYSDSQLIQVIKDHPDTARELFVKMKEDDRYGGAELRALGGQGSVFVDRESESIVSHHNLEAATSPLDVMAGRMSGKDVTGLRSFVSHADRARDMMATGVKLNPMSKDPAEAIAYGARNKGIDLDGLVDRLRTSEGYKFDDFKDIPGTRQSSQALTVFKAMTGDDRSQQQIDKADLITPQLHKDAASDKFVQDAVKVTSAFNRITDYYLDPLELSRDSGLGENKDLERTRSRVRNYLEQKLPSQVTNQAINLAQTGRGAWADALPTPDEVASHLGKSKFADVYSPYLRTLQKEEEFKAFGGDSSGFLKPQDFKDEIKTIQRAFKASNEGGLKHTFDPDRRSNVHEMDAVSRFKDSDSAAAIVETSFVDPVTGLTSTSSESTYESEASRYLDELYEDRDLQRKSVNYRERDSGVPELSSAEKASVREAIEEEERGYSSVHFPKTSTPHKANPGIFGSLASTAPKVSMSPDFSQPTSSSSYSNKGERFWEGARQARAYIPGLKKDAEENRRRQKAFFEANPDLAFIADDEDKHEEGSVWHRERQGLLGSSSVPNIFHPKRSKSTIKGLFTGALKSDEEKHFKPSSSKFNINFSAGDALEEHGIGWYKANVDDSIFEPGMLRSTDPTKRGQSSTPDAMTEDGRKVVEFKSAQYLSDPYADPSTQEGRNQRQQWQTYYAQLQHQMYITGAQSGDVVQMMKDPLNPHLPDGGKFTSDNIQRKTFERDDDYIKRMSPVWEQLGQSADSLSGLDPKVQKGLAKAVSDGNVDAYEKLNKKHGFDSDGTIQDVLFGGSGGKGGKGGGGGGGGGSGFGGMSGTYSPNTKSILRSAASLHPVGRAVNMIAAMGEAVYDTADEYNEKTLGYAAQARGSGYRDEDMFVQVRDAMKTGRYVNEADAVHDIAALTQASGGLQTGHTAAAVRMVTATRGALTFEDIHGLDPEDPEAVNSLIAQTERRMRDRGDSDFAISAMMKESSLRSGLSVDASSMKGRRSFNEGMVTVNTNIEELQKTTVSAFGKVGDDIVGAIKSLFSADVSANIGKTRIDSGVPATIAERNRGIQGARNSKPSTQGDLGANNLPGLSLDTQETYERIYSTFKSFDHADDIILNHNSVINSVDQETLRVLEQIAAGLDAKEGPEVAVYVQRNAQGVVEVVAKGPDGEVKETLGVLN